MDMGLWFEPIQISVSQINNFFIIKFGKYQFNHFQLYLDRYVLMIFKSISNNDKIMANWI